LPAISHGTATWLIALQFAILSRSETTAKPAETALVAELTTLVLQLLMQPFTALTLLLTEEVPVELTVKLTAQWAVLDAALQTVIHYWEVLYCMMQDKLLALTSVLSILQDLSVLIKDLTPSLADFTTLKLLFPPTNWFTALTLHQTEPQFVEILAPTTANKSSKLAMELIPFTKQTRRA